MLLILLFSTIIIGAIIGNLHDYYKNKNNGTRKRK